ncbi:MAG TPA: HD domain-containing protein [Bacteroidia bacterium]|nr:HD domain-containing protein [Bacteroidia bacterium]
MQFREAEKYIKELLQSGLPGSLFYHNYDHTIEVLKAVIQIAHEEEIGDEDLVLLKTAALFHDSGFINAYHGHEEEGCLIARKQLPLFDYSDEQVEKICALIMATKTPQNPQTHLEKILCDADLYYLGTDSFTQTGQKLFREWLERGKIYSEKEWNQVQIKFLESHRYFTKSAIANAEKKKAEHLQKLKQHT